MRMWRFSCVDPPLPHPCCFLNSHPNPGRMHRLSMYEEDLQHLAYQHIDREQLNSSCEPFPVPAPQAMGDPATITVFTLKSLCSTTVSLLFQVSPIQHHSQSPFYYYFFFFSILRLHARNVFVCGQHCMPVLACGNTSCESFVQCDVQVK
jgi:hypothetical protein